MVHATIKTVNKRDCIWGIEDDEIDPDFIKRAIKELSLTPSQKKYFIGSSRVFFKFVSENLVTVHYYREYWYGYHDSMRINPVTWRVDYLTFSAYTHPRFL